jgi:hypothetical protein
MFDAVSQSSPYHEVLELTKKAQGWERVVACDTRIQSLRTGSQVARFEWSDVQGQETLGKKLIREDL